MNLKKILGLITLTLILGSNVNVSAKSDTIPLKGNGYITSPDAEESLLSYGKNHRPPHARSKVVNTPTAYIDESNNGIGEWNSKESVVSVYFRAENSGTMELSIIAKGHSTITIKCLGKKKNIKLSSDEPKTYKVGTYKVKKAGHVKVDIQGKKIGADGTFGNVLDLIVKSDDMGELAYIRRNYHPHFGRRGPSVHLNYPLPKDKTIEWFYNEVTVPADYDRVSSYYMACGFGEGYFGFQNNLPARRRVLFFGVLM